MNKLQDQARVVIIGGGIAGVSIAYHLTQMGLRDVIVIEKGVLTSGSTWHAAGLVGQLRSHRNVSRMLQYSVSLYAGLESETGLTTGWKRCGCLHLAGTPERLRELKQSATTARSFGLDLHLISPQQALDLFPIMSLDGIIGAAFMPSDGQADPSGLTLAMAKGATGRGAKIYQCTRATGFHFKGNRVTAVVTDRGTIRCETVVNAAGLWAREVGRMMGVNVPLVPFQHQYLITAPIQGLPPGLPTVRDKDSLLYYKDEGGGLVMGGYEPDGIPWALDGIPEQFTQQLLSPNFDQFEPLAAAAIRRTPCLETAGIVRLVNGPEAFTPDGNCILGPAPELQNCFVAAGFNAFGIAAGGGAGKMVAEWIVAGEPSLNIWPLDIRRFGQHHRSASYNLERTAEIYGKHYAISWPNEEHRSARGVRRSPLYLQLESKGAVYGSKFGWERANWFAPAGAATQEDRTFGLPNWFCQVGEEHRAARERVVLIDQTSFSKFLVEGPQSASFLNRLAANDIDRPTGSIVYTQLCNGRGGIECDLTIARLAESKFLIVTGTAFATHDLDWIQRHLPPDSAVTISDVTSAWAVINVCGPLARRLLKKVTADSVANEVFPFGQCRHLTLGHAPVLAMRITYIGELGYELYMPTEYASQVYERLWEAGRELGVANAGYRALESLRLEKGYRYWGAELSPDYNPYQAGLGYCVALHKQDFLGREALQKIKLAGPDLTLCCFTLNDSKPRLLHGGETISRDGKVLGVVTSGGYGHFVKETIAYGYLPVQNAGFSEGYTIEVFTENLPATRRSEVLYDPERKRILA